MVQVGEDTPYILQFTSQDILEQAKKLRLNPKRTARQADADLKVMPKFNQSTSTISPLQEGN
jgi:hypothetical protein